MVNIEDAFPVDPFQPTVCWAGISQTPFVVPWTGKTIRLGLGFNTQLRQEDALFMRDSAFDSDAVGKLPLQYRQCQSTLLQDNSAAATSDATEHVSFSVDASVGGKLLGLSGRGSYEKHARNSMASSNVSVRAEHTCGQVEPVHLPALSRAACRLLANSDDPREEFSRTFGDYFVGGFRLGALNYTLVSGDLADKRSFEAKRVQIKIKAFFTTTEKNFDETKHSENIQGGITITALDTLKSFYVNYCARTYDESIELAEIAAGNRQDAMNIAARAIKSLDEHYGLYHGQIIDQDTVDRLCESGWITELLLIPYCSLRDYQSICSLRSRERQ